MQNKNLVGYLQNVHAQLLKQEKQQRKTSFVQTLRTKQSKIGIVFAGQGFDYLAEIHDLYHSSSIAKQWIETANQSLLHWIQRPEILSKGLFPLGLHAIHWIQSDKRPPSSYLERVSVSHTLILIAQIARYLHGCELGLSSVMISKQISFVSGYSQGMIPAFFVAEMIDQDFSMERALQYLEYTFWQGILMEEQWLRLNQPEHQDFTPMASISGIEYADIQKAVTEIQNILDEGEQITIAIQASRTRFVISGPGHALENLYKILDAKKNSQIQKKKQGLYGGKILQFIWENIPVAAAFHNEMLKEGIETLQSKCQEIGFSISPQDLKVPVLRYDKFEYIQKDEDVLRYLITCQFVLPVQWFSLMSTIAASETIDVLLDFGPGDGLGRLSASTLRGSKIEIISLSSSQGQERLFSIGSKYPDRLIYADYIPTIVQDKYGSRIDNAFTQSTGCPPIILPGMTPTTSDVDIVVAAANAGYVAELAGGGQVSEKIFWTRMDELKRKLHPGQGIVFNALFLDRYLWDLHFGKHNLVLKARQAGYPICGVTISAGIPDVDEAVELFSTFQKNGIWLNALKAGNEGQVKQIIQIAQALPEQTLFLHLEGGKAGGHHSWEDLEQLLLSSYHLIRSCSNLVLCVGGGIATEERATELLNGSWSLAYQLLPMPVDAIFLGTICMATLEAKTSLQVKEALVKTAGTSQWVFAGQQAGGMTSGKSQLNADIHYVDNFAAQCGRLLDSVAGNAEKVQTHYHEIVAALNKTAKPFFGVIEEMTYQKLLERMLALMAVGLHDPYEDGCWPDRSFRERFADMLWRSEARLHPQQEGEFQSFFQNLEELDNPDIVLQKFFKNYPIATSQLIHPSDKTYFVNKICRRPGKPVNFVPVIDEDVRRWYKSDSLWYSHDDRFEADQVLIIPGPEAIRGIEQVNEPIAQLFGRFEQRMKASLGKKEDFHILNRDSYREKYKNIQLDIVDNDIIVKSLKDDVDWFSIIPTDLQFGVIAFWGQSQVLCGDRMEENILRRVCVARAGSTLTITSDAFICHPYPNHDSKVVLREIEDGKIILEMFDADVSDLSKPLFTQMYRPFYREGSNIFRIDEEQKATSIMDLYHSMLFGNSIEITPLFSTATDHVQFSESELQGYLTALGERGLMPTLNFMFSLGWKPLFSVLSCTEIRSGLLDLVHLSNDVQTKTAWPPKVDEVLEAKARIFRLETKHGGQAVSVQLSIDSERGCCAEVLSEFFIRKSPNQTLPKRLISMPIDDFISIQNKTQMELIKNLPFITIDSDIKEGQVLQLQGNKNAQYLWNNQNIFLGSGKIYTGGTHIGSFHIDQKTINPQHPIDRLLEICKEPTSTGSPVRKLIREEHCWAPTNMAGYANVSRDKNPIHQSRLFANLAGMDSPIVHGMWTAGQMHSVLRRCLKDDLQSRIQSFKVLFDAPLPLGGALLIRVWKTGYQEGSNLVEIQAIHVDNSKELVVARAHAVVLPLITAYVFPGQGIQDQNMGMDLYKKSAAVRKIWNQADDHTRDQLGFSILRVVQKNPTIIHVGRQIYRHPKGVLNLTQFTQVAMATMAQAQVAWMKEEGIFNPHAITCGHSVGEYNAISAVLQAIPLEEVISVVWHRGLTMHTIVERDEKGRSKYKMGVIRPHYAKLNHQQAEELVSHICETSGYFLEIVNYNVRGRQYSVTGETQALDILEEFLQKTAVDGKKPYLEIPGIDVPFHSRLLVKGVADFRNTLHNVFPSKIDHNLLIGRYIPNLTATVFRMEPSFMEEILQVVDSEPIKNILANWEKAISEPSDFCRTVLIELLAWQFASPVRWIETQELMFLNKKHGGLGVQDMVEIGSAKQPTLTNMGNYSLSMHPFHNTVSIYNIETEIERLFGVDVIAPPKETPSVEEQSIPVPMIQPVAPIAIPASTSTIVDAPLTHATALQFLIAKQANIRLDQIETFETIDEIFEGVSSKRNQLLLDLGSEFSIGAIDAAHEKPLQELSKIIQERSPSWNIGPYISNSIDDACKNVFGRANMGQSDINQKLQQDFALPSGIIAQSWLILTLESRDGKSSRGGNLGALKQFPTDKKGIDPFLTEWMNIVGGSLHLPIQRVVGAQGGGQVDGTLLKELHDQILGKDGFFLRNIRSMAEDLGHNLDRPYENVEAYSGMDVIEGELSDEYMDRLRPIFSSEKHAPFLSVWSAAHAQVSSMLYQVLEGHLQDKDLKKIASRLSAFRHDKRIQNAVDYNISVLQNMGRDDLIPYFHSIVEGSLQNSLEVDTSRPHIRISSQGEYLYSEIENKDPNEFMEWVCSNVIPEEQRQWRSVIEKLRETCGDFSDLTVLITGASPDSIAIEIVRQLLRGNAKVVITTTSFYAKRMSFYRDIYNRDAGPDAQLHILPYNQASLQDADQLIDWLFSSEYELQPNIILPFGAVKAYGALSDMNALAEVSMRAMLTGVERLVANVGVKLLQAGGGECHVILPLSPNHGIFGGDGLYAESKAALEVLLQKCLSEEEQWSHHITMCGVIIGWVRGTGLMSDNNIVAHHLEQELGVRTFSTSEMGFLISSLCTPTLYDTSEKVQKIDLSGGLLGAKHLKKVVHEIRSNLEYQSIHQKNLSNMMKQFNDRGYDTNKISKALPLPLPEQRQNIRFSTQKNLQEQVVIVGYGEIGPCGSSRTRFAMEMSDQLAPAAITELAWITGLIRYENASWVDSKTGNVVEDTDISEQYREQILHCTGIRFIDPTTVGFNTRSVQTWVIAYLDKPFHFTVSSKEDAETYCAADPEKITMSFVDGEWKISLLAGTQIRLPKNIEFSRHVAGIVPDGFDFSRYGIPNDMLESVDRLTLFNLVATVDAWISAGLTPEELLEHVHPARIGNTQSSGIGGMRSLTKLYTDPVLGKERQNDILQETLLNVMAAYVVQSYVGSYGPMSHPVGACATAALSIESGMEKILLQKADFVVTGGFDDIGIEGMFGFADMNATAPTDDMLTKGFEPKEFSRSNDIRRGGFVEAQGGGTILLARGDIALQLGLPVYGVLGCAGSYSDGIHRSIPAPGKGLLAMALGKEDSLLGSTLRSYGLSTDDIGVVYKHDTSTNANDVNENEIHHRIQVHLGRSRGNPLWVVSQKTITGHSKGGAAAWQVIGLCQALNTQKIPGNKNLSCVDPSMRKFDHLCFTNEDVHFSPESPLKAGLVTSLGFGHVSAGLLVLHPDVFITSIPEGVRTEYLIRSRQRKRFADSHWEEIQMGKIPAFQRVQDRRFVAKDGTQKQNEEECQMLLSTSAKLRNGIYTI